METLNFIPEENYYPEGPTLDSKLTEMTGQKISDLLKEEYVVQPDPTGLKYITIIKKSW